MRARLSAVISLTATLVAPALPARATPATFITAVAYTYMPGDADTPDLPLTVTQGGRLLYSNADPLGYHSIVSYATDASDEPIFSAPLSGTSEVVEVEGVSALSPGRYGFFCDVHGTIMEGELSVTPPI